MGKIENANLAKVLHYLEYEYDLFKPSLSKHIVDHIEEVCHQKLGLSWEETDLIQNAFFGYVIGVDQLSVLQLFDCYDSYVDRLDEEGEDNKLLRAMMAAIRAEAAGR